MGTQLLGDNVKKIHEVNVAGLGKCAVAACGALSLLGPWKHHLQTEGLSQLEGCDMEDMYMEGIILTNKGKLIFANIFGHWYNVDFAPYALGSGQDLALAFMHNGMNAVESVRSLIKSELSCGGNIQTYDWRAKTYAVVPL